MIRSSQEPRALWETGETADRILFAKPIQPRKYESMLLKFRSAASFPVCAACLIRWFCTLPNLIAMYNISCSEWLEWRAVTSPQSCARWMYCACVPVLCVQNVRVDVFFRLELSLWFTGPSLTSSVIRRLDAFFCQCPVVIHLNGGALLMAEIGRRPGSMARP